MGAIIVKPPTGFSLSKTPLRFDRRTLRRKLPRCDFLQASADRSPSTLLRRVEPFRIAFSSLSCGFYNTLALCSNYIVLYRPVKHPHLKITILEAAILAGRLAHRLPWPAILALAHYLRAAVLGRSAAASYVVSLSPFRSFAASDQSGGAVSRPSQKDQRLRATSIHFATSSGVCPPITSPCGVL